MTEIKSKCVFIIICITVMTVLFSMTSCGIQFGDYHRWQEVHGNKTTCSTSELMYYVQEDLHNGNLDSTVAQLYIDKINEISECCENCDEID